MKHPICQSKNDKNVYVQLNNSKAAKQISRHPQLVALVKEVLSTRALKGRSIAIEQDMHRPVGYDMIVLTSDSDFVYYARVIKDTVYTRFVKNGKPIITSYVTLSLAEDSLHEYELIDLRIGCLAPPIPGDFHETAESKLFWSNHACILEDQSLQTSTVTKICPY